MDRRLFFLFFLISQVYSKPKIDGRIVGGDPTTIEQHPHQVSVIYIDSHYCGGSIISENHILTAAHCTINIPPEDLYVRAGSTLLNSGGQFKEVSEIHQHNDYNSQTYDNDISVLTLKSSLSFGSGVQAIPIPDQSTEGVDGNLMGTATGWGRLYADGPIPVELQEVQLPTITSDVCELVYGSLVTERMLCAGYIAGNKDTCQGDSGGPYVYNGILLGITSWGDGCGAANSPGVYTKVSAFRTYIDQVVNGGQKGEENLKMRGRIMGGDNATIEEYPYQVLITRHDSVEDFKCGGSIISENHILTAAHCINSRPIEEFSVMVGSSVIDGNQGLKISDYCQHKFFDADTFNFDIAILTLEEPLTFGESIQPIQLPSEENLDEGLMGTATGWGRLEYYGPFPDLLQKVDLPIYNFDECKEAYENFVVSENMFCAGYKEGGKDTCPGDSGGPFAKDGVLLGITSWGIDCGAANSPGVYTNVYRFLDFTNDYVNDNECNK